MRRDTDGEARTRRLADVDPGGEFEIRQFARVMDRQARRIAAAERVVPPQARAPCAELAPGSERPATATSAMVRPDALRARQDALMLSEAWRLSTDLHDLFTRHPRIMRWIWRTGRLLGWSVTRQLRARLREKRRRRHEIALLRDSILFDAGWYRARHGLALPDDTDAVMHYLWFGAPADLDPHPLFDSAFYRAAMPAGTADANPLAHYLSTGGAVDPHPLFDTAHYRRSLPGPLPAGATPLEHMLAAGDAAAAANPVFDPLTYLAEYPAAAGHRYGPLGHYLLEGEAAGLHPHPLFDPRWYAARHPLPGNRGPLAHYLRHGAGERPPTSAAVERFGAAAPPFPVTLAFPDAADPEVSIIVPAYGHLHETWRCLAAVMVQTVGVTFEVLVADDRPADPIAPGLRGRNLSVHVNPANLGFLHSCNAAARRARGRMLLFLNNDTSVGADWLRPMVAAMHEDPRAGMVGAKLLNEDGTIQEAGGIIFGNGWGHPFGAGMRDDSGAFDYKREVDVVTGACFLVRRDLFEHAGGFDVRYAPAFYEEFDLATTLRVNGSRVLYQPLAQVVHHGSASYGIETRDRQSSRNHALFCRKWRTLLAAQPAAGDPLFLSRERPAPRGVILVIDDKVPEYDKHAGAVTLFQYLRLMVELGLKVVFHPQDGKPLEPYAGALQRLGIEIVRAPETLEHWLDGNGRHLDYVWTARPYVTFPILDLLRRTTGAPILYYTHDLHYLREARRHRLDGSAWALEESERVKPMELGIFAAVDHVMTPSAEEAAVIAAEVPEAAVTVVPPYLFGEAAPRSDAPRFEHRADVIFVGGFDHTPNVDAALWLVAEIMPLVWADHPDARALIVGNEPTEDVRALARADDRVTVTGFVPELDPWYDRARVSISPLRYGAGVKGKIVGALQAGVPVVTTSCGNEGIQLRHGHEALIADDAAGLAGAVSTLLADADACRAMALAGAAVVRTRFSAERARSVLLTLLGDDLCPVCGTRPRNGRVEPGADWRESVSCNTCGALNRQAAVAEILLRPLRGRRCSSLREALPSLRGQRIHEFGPDGAILAELRRLDGMSCSNFRPGVAPGDTAPDGVQCQDVQALRFADASFDLLISQEVLEHVPDPARAFRELFRVLKPGGRHVFTVPYEPDAPETLRRARLASDGTVEHILPPEYHGDPVDPDGALVFSEYGSDLVELLARTGFAVRVHEIERGRGRRIHVFETTRPAGGDAP